MTAQSFRQSPSISKRNTLAIALSLALGLFLAMASPLFAQQAMEQGPKPPEPLPTYELDKKGQKAHLDFSLDIHPISDANLKFSQFAKHKLMVFYFSAKCPHCQHAAPHVQKLADELTAKGFQCLAIAIKYNSEDDIRSFIREFRLHMPVFHDDSRKFGENYGTGSIPMLIVANEKGEYVRFKSFDADETPRQVLTEANLFAQK